MSDKAIEVLRHILDARIDNASTPYEYTLLCDIRDIVEYALADNLDCPYCTEEEVCTLSNPEEECDDYYYYMEGNE